MLNFHADYFDAGYMILFFLSGLRGAKTFLQYSVEYKDVCKGHAKVGMPSILLPSVIACRRTSRLAP